jgi:hypothetical protein
MRTGPDFRQILDGKLEDAGFARPTRPDRRAAGGSQSAPRPVFLFGDIRSGFTAGPARPSANSSAPAWTSVYGARPGVQSRPARRRLAPAEQQALESLRALGAGSLDEQFTDAELKSAFRSLARRLHPDRHPGSSDAERARLSRDFASACDAYRALTTRVH